MAQKCYVTDNGLPRAVPTIDKLPKNAFIGYTCYVESGETGLYLYTGEEGYIAIEFGDRLEQTNKDDTDAGVDGPKSIAKMSATANALPTYTTVSALPADAESDALGYVSSTKAVYRYSGSGWTKVAPAVASEDDFPATPTEEQKIWLLGTGLFTFNGKEWESTSL